MNYFPAADPIPLPAPVWLFKFLNNLTLTAHLAAVDLLLGGLMLGLALHAAGRWTARPVCTQVGGMFVHRLPTVMAFVINLGVPPLLFAQVLYGRALYTSSVLIGAYWISVIFLLMASYFGLYYSAKRAEAKRSWTATGFAALLMVLAIAFIYSNNMTLMLRPQEWAAMYRHSPGGVQWNASDPALWPRWLFFVLSSFGVAGCASMLLAQRAHFPDEVRRFLFRAGGWATFCGLVLQTSLVFPLLRAQPAGVFATMMTDPIYSYSAYAWFVSGAVAALAAAAALFRGTPSSVIATSAALAGFLNIAATVMVRDGIRDVTLRMAGFEVWDRQVATNWSVVILFLLLLVGALVAIAYLVRVVATARRVEENYA